MRGWFNEMLGRRGIKYEDLTGTLRLEAGSGSMSECTATMQVAVVDHRPIALLFPSSRRVVLERLGKLLRADDVSLAPCDAVDRIFGGRESGACHPLPDLRDVSVLMDATLLSARTMEIRANGEQDTVRLSLEDWLAAANPGLGFFTEPDRGGNAGSSGVDPTPF